MPAYRHIETPLPNNGHSVTEEEAAELVDRLLAELVERSSLDVGRTPQEGLVNAVQAEIAAGVPVQVKLKVKNEQSVDDPIAGARSTEGSARGEFIQRRDYTSLEQLEILVEALRLAAVAPPLMASQLFSTLREFSPPGTVPVVNLVSESVPEQFRAVNAEEVEPAVINSARLRAILDELLARHDPVPRAEPETSS